MTGDQASSPNPEADPDHDLRITPCRNWNAVKKILGKGPEGRPSRIENRDPRVADRYSEPLWSMPLRRPPLVGGLQR